MSKGTLGVWEHCEYENIREYDSIGNYGNIKESIRGIGILRVMGTYRVMKYN